jgi:hypothetical protein
MLNFGEKKNQKMKKKSKLDFLMKIVGKLQILIKFDRDNFILSKINVFFIFVILLYGSKLKNY